MSNVRVIVWRDVLIVSDDGRSVPADYDELYDIGAELTETSPNGIGLLAIIPRNSTPPSSEVRSAMNRVLGRGPELRAACWCIESSGFEAAAVRAVLLGMRFFRSAPYPRHTAGNVPASLRWLLPLLDGGALRAQEVDGATNHIRRQRERAGPRENRASR
jgi:hypothetical protein